MDRIDDLLRETLGDLPVSSGGLEETMRRVQSRRRRRTAIRAAGAALLTVIVGVAALSELPDGTPPASATTVRLPGKIIDAVGASGRI